MKKDLTEMVFILDRSGSMAGMETDVVGGFNSLIEKQRSEPGEALVSTVLFSTESQVVHDRVRLDAVTPMTREDYCAAGCTALLDAVGDAIRHIRNVHRYAREEDVPERTLFVITTDGMENASRRHTLEEVRQLIGRQQEEGWEFLFLGANIDAIGTAGSIGIRHDRAANFHCDSQGVERSFAALDEALCMMRCVTPSITPEWKNKIDEDYNSRR